MSETSGSVGIRNSRGTMYDVLRDNYDKRQIVKQELRRQELLEKAKEGQLTKDESTELFCYRAADQLEKLAALGDSTVIYTA